LDNALDGTFPESSKLTHLIEVWPSLSEDVKKQIYVLAGLIEHNPTIQGDNQDGKCKQTQQVLFKY
jgi:hypothetical protein